MKAAQASPLERQPLVGNVKVTRDDWLRAALELLISDGVEAVKVAVIGARLNVSRSSFYWYFNSRNDLLDALLEHWQSFNTAALIQQAETGAPTITAAVCNVFRCVVNPDLFDNRLDFAVRDWARKSGSVRHVLEQSDGRRLEALSAMFRRYGYDEIDAITRARSLYYMQIGLNEAELHEPMAERMKLLPNYLAAFTGRKPKPQEISEFINYTFSIRGEAEHE